MASKKIRIACGIDESGNWGAYGWRDGEDYLFWDAMDGVAEFAGAQSRFWIEVEVPIPEKTVLEGAITDTLSIEQAAHILRQLGLCVEVDIDAGVIVGGEDPEDTEFGVALVQRPFRIEAHGDRWDIATRLGQVSHTTSTSSLQRAICYVLRDRGDPEVMPDSAPTDISERPRKFRVHMSETWSEIVDVAAGEDAEVICAEHLDGLMVNVDSGWFEVTEGDEDFED